MTRADGQGVEARLCGRVKIPWSGRPGCHDGIRAGIAWPSLKAMPAGMRAWQASSPLRGCYSYRNAAMGSRRAAFNAGHRPKNRPTLVATANPAAADHSGTVEGRLGTRMRIDPP